MTRFRITYCPQTYALSVTYGDWGKIQQYDLSQTDLANNLTTSVVRNYNYGSLNEGQTAFAPNNINYADGTNVNEQYGIGGSQQRRETNRPGSQPETEHYRFTANGNLQAYMYENLLYVHYGYNAANTRTYKYSFDLNPNWVNGRLEAVNFNPHTAMFYPNSYLNFNQDGHYTKHYYNGMERIASRLGDQNLPIHTHDPELQDRKDWQDSLIRKNIVEITGYEFLEPGEEQNPEDPKPVFELPQVGLNNLTPNTSSVYYYHPNHLGSTCYVTDENASVVQGFLYAPFGEITNEYNAGWQSGTLPKYSFNAKELDEETGMYYYEARYMAPPTFTSRDPLFEKYPSFSPYAYCANNPVKFIDPTGMEIDPTCLDDWNEKKTAIQNRKDALIAQKNELSNKTSFWGSYSRNIKIKKLNERIKSLDETLSTMNNLEGDQSTKYTLFNVEKNGGTGLIKEGDKKGMVYIKSSSISSFVHEVTHAGQFYNNEIGFFMNGNIAAYDIYDEVAAYKAALAYDPYAYDNKHMYMWQVTPEWVLTRSKTYSVSNGCGSIPINLNSSAEEIKKSGVNNLGGYPTYSEIPSELIIRSKH